MSNNLFQPTVHGRPVAGRRPWRPESIFYVAFFGGPLAAGLLGVLNGRRLALPSSHVLLTGLAAVAGFGGWMVLAALADANNLVRLAGSVTGSLAWLVVIAFQRGPFRAWSYTDEKPASLVGPGVAAAIGCGILQAAIILLVIR